MDFTIKKNSAAHFLSKRTAELLFQNILLRLLHTAAHKGIEQLVGHQSEHKPEARQIARQPAVANDKALDERPDTATANHHHKYTGSHLSVFAQAGNRQIENRAPHHRCAKTAEDEEQHAYRQYDCGNFKAVLLVNTEHIHCNGFRQIDGQRKENKPYDSDKRKHRAARHLSTHGTANQTADEHQQPVNARNRAGSGRGCRNRFGIFFQIVFNILQREVCTPT